MANDRLRCPGMFIGAFPSPEVREGYVVFNVERLQAAMAWLKRRYDLGRTSIYVVEGCEPKGIRVEIFKKRRQG